MPAPEAIVSRAAVEDLIRLSPHIPNIRGALAALEERGIIVVIDDPQPAATAAVGMRPRGVA